MCWSSAGGPVGQACALAARRSGVRALMVSEPDPHRRAVLADLGVPAVDPEAGSVGEAFRERFGSPASVVLDAVGSTRSLADALASCASSGRVVLVGMHEPVVSVPAYEVSIEERSLVGSSCYSVAEFRATAAWAATVSDGLARLVEQRVDLREAPDAFRGLADGSWSAGKVLVFPPRGGGPRVAETTGVAAAPPAESTVRQGLRPTPAHSQEPLGSALSGSAAPQTLHQTTSGSASG